MSEKIYAKLFARRVRADFAKGIPHQQAHLTARQMIINHLKTQKPQEGDSAEDDSSADVSTAVKR